MISETFKAKRVFMSKKKREVITFKLCSAGVHTSHISFKKIFDVFLGTLVIILR